MTDYQDALHKIILLHPSDTTPDIYPVSKISTTFGTSFPVKWIRNLSGGKLQTAWKIGTDQATGILFEDNLVPGQLWYGDARFFYAPQNPAFGETTDSVRLTFKLVRIRKSFETTLVPSERYEDLAEIKVGLEKHVVWPGEWQETTFLSYTLLLGKGIGPVFISSPDFTAELSEYILR